MVLSDNLVSYWRMNTLSDSVGSNSLTLFDNAAIIGSGLIDGCIDFDGSGDYMTSADDNSLDLVDNFTISLWFQKDDTNPSKFIEKGDNEYEVDYWGGNIRFNKGGVAVMISVSHTVDANWHHVVAQKSGSNVYLWLDGVKSSSSGAPSLSANITDLHFGKRSAFDPEYLNGRLCEVGLWSRVLSDSEVGLLYNSGKGFTYPFIEFNGIIPAKINGVAISDISGAIGL